MVFDKDTLGMLEGSDGRVTMDIFVDYVTWVRECNFELTIIIA
jgi:hypothetical protein